MGCSAAACSAVKFRQSPDFYYLTGIEEPNAILVLLGKSKKSLVFLDKPAENMQRWIGHNIWQEPNFKEKYGIDGLFPFNDFWIYLSFNAHGAPKVYVPLTSPDYVDLARNEENYYEMNLQNYPINNYMPLWMQAVKKIRETLPFVELDDINPLIDELRWIKSPYEIEQLKTAGKIGAEGVLEAIKITKSGMFEYELEAVATYYYVKRGARGDAFPPIVASGPEYLHYSL